MYRSKQNLKTSYLNTDSMQKELHEKFDEYDPNS